MNVCVRVVMFLDVAGCESRFGCVFVRGTNLHVDVHVSML